MAPLKDLASDLHQLTSKPNRVRGAAGGGEGPRCWGREVVKLNRSALPAPCAYSVCQDGRWLCAQAQCPAECAVGGDGHYVTFDGRSFSFRGSPGCRSSLVQVGRG